MAKCSQQSCFSTPDGLRKIRTEMLHLPCEWSRCEVQLCHLILSGYGQGSERSEGGLEKV